MADFEQKKTMLKLAEEIMKSYYSYVGPSPAPQVWTAVETPIGGDYDVRVMVKNDINGVVASATTSFWLPVPCMRLFDYLRNENMRIQVVNYNISTNA